jgi:glycosyltransferase 2 family protein
VTPRTRNLAVFVAKVLVAALLIGWLVRGGNLDPTSLRILVDRPLLLLLNLGVFGLGAVIGTVRFRILLGLARVEASFGTLFRLQMTAFFFNVVIPGNIGGDVLKALYVARDSPPEKRTSILLLTFIERLLGLVALILMGGLVTLLRGSAIFSDPLFRPLALTVVLLGAATIAGGTLSLLFVRYAGARLDRHTSGPSKIAKVLNQLVSSARLVSAGPGRILAALGLSMVFHAGAMGYFTILTRAVLETDTPLSAIATVFPLGLLSLMLPISPAGLGVGHVAFKRLFEAIGLAGGASVFNVYLLGQLAPCLLGVFPFLGLRRRGELPPEALAKPSEAEHG